MNASPAMIAAFEDWKLAELGSHYAEGCPDEVMDRLTENAQVAFNTLQGLTPTNADDMLLKLFPVLLREMEPKKGDPPLKPSTSDRYGYVEAFFDRLVDDLRLVSGHLRMAVDAPHYALVRSA